MNVPITFCWSEHFILRNLKTGVLSSYPAASVKNLFNLGHLYNRVILLPSLLPNIRLWAAKSPGLLSVLIHKDDKQSVSLSFVYIFL